MGRSPRHDLTVRDATPGDAAALRMLLLDANAGDYFPSFIRMNGFDHVVLYGKAPSWTVIIIREGVVALEDGTPYAGMDNIDMREAIARDTGGTWARNLAMVNITRAGENGVLASGVMAGPKAIYARGGPGAKMGSLGLKAIVTLAQTHEFPTAQPYKPYNRVIAQKLISSTGGNQFALHRLNENVDRE